MLPNRFQRFFNLCKVIGRFYLVAVFVVGFYAFDDNRNVGSDPACTVEIIIFAITVNLKAAINNYQYDRLLLPQQK